MLPYIKKKHTLLLEPERPINVSELLLKRCFYIIPCHSTSSKDYIVVYYKKRSLEMTFPDGK